MAEELKQVATVNKYDKTPWTNGSTPAIDADHLNKIEQGIFDVTEATNKSIGAVNTLNKNVTSLDTNLTALDKTVSENNTDVNNRIDSLTLLNLNDLDPKVGIVVLDGGNGKPTTEQET